MEFGRNYVLCFLQGSYVVDILRFDGGKLPAAIPVVQYSGDPITLDLF